MKELVLLLIFAAAGLLGYKLINEVPSLLHTPLMSGVTVLGALVTTALAVTLGSRLAGFAALVLAMINVVAGFFGYGSHAENV